MLNRSVAFVSPAGIRKIDDTNKNKMYAEEKAAIKESFASFSGITDWSDSEVQKQFKAFAKQVISRTIDMADQQDLVSLVLPTERVAPGDTFVLHELSGANIYYGTYGAAVRMSRPQFTKYSGTANLKEVGLKLNLTEIQTGKYSPSELGDYVANLITAWRNRLLLTTTLTGSTVWQSAGAQYQTGATLSVADMSAAYNKLTDESDARVIIGRRLAIHKLSTMTSAWSYDSLDEFKNVGQVGRYAGTPVVKVNSFTDRDYGTVSPCVATDLWIFSELPAGRFIVSSALRTADETVPSSETLNLYYRFDDGIAIWHNDRIVRVGAIT